MTPPERLRVLVEAAFPGAAISRDPDIADWLVTLPAPLRIGGDEVDTISLRDDAYVAGCTLVPSAERSSTSSRRIRGTIRQMLHDASAHDLLAARRRLGL